MSHNHNEHSHEHDHSHEHNHSHDHNHNHGFEETSAFDFIKLIISALLFILGLVFLKFFSEFAGNILIISAFVLSGYEVVFNAVKSIFHGHLFDEEFLMSVASIGALCIGEIPEAAAVMILYEIGELLQNYAVGKSRKSIKSLMDIRPDTANLYSDSVIKKVRPSEVNAGDIIIVNPGEKIPLDGTVTEGHSYLDTSALTGESLPREVIEGSECFSGCINTSGVIKIRVTNSFAESTVSKILELVENAESKKSNSENFITKFSVIYTPIVVGLAVIIALLPPILLPLIQVNIDSTFKFWIYKALAFLVVSCPCALIISVPLSYFAGLGAASKNGILIKGSNYLEALCNVKYALFDKTGTLTKGIFTLIKTVPFNNFTQEEVLKYAALAETHSSHPIALAIKNQYTGKRDEVKISSLEEKAGFGIKAAVDGKNILLGNSKLMEENGIEYVKSNDRKTSMYLSIDGTFAGYMIISDTVKEDAKETVSSLKTTGISEIVMVTGDEKEPGEEIANELGIHKVFTGLLPGDKTDIVSTYVQKGKTFFVGDGINDAPALACSDIGIAMGGLGSDAAIEAADIVIMNDAPSKLITAFKIARKTHRISVENIIFALSIKVLFLILITVGVVGMWAAVFADVGVCLLAVLNSLRCLKNE